MNWKKLITELLELGLSQTDIAREIECHQTLVSYWLRTGAEPKWSVGQKLIALRDFEVFRAARPALLRG